MNNWQTRSCDLILALVGLVISSPLFLGILILGYFDTGSPIFLQRRVGRHKRPFVLIKFRTMTVGTVSAATHLTSASAVTRLGGILRRTKLDELPQLINVLRGDMSLVGPRPCLENQGELIDARDRLGVYDVLPGITGLAQVNGVDMSNPSLLAEWDAEMIRNYSLINYWKLIFYTVKGDGSGDRIKN